MILPRLDRFLTLCRFGSFANFGMLSCPGIPILMYHSISDAAESGHPYFWLNTSPTRFAAQMDFLKRNNYQAITITKAMEILGIVEKTSIDLNESGSGESKSHRVSASDALIDENQFGYPRKYVVLTFDDGYQDFLHNAWPVLQETGFTATVFVSTGFIGNNRNRLNGRTCLTWSEIRELSGQGVSFGSHTTNHLKLYGLAWNEVRQELLDSRRRLEDELHIPVSSFAYPYAFPQEDRRFVFRFRQELLDQGYRIAVTTAIGRMGSKSDPLCLKRLPVNERDDETLFNAKLSGAYDWLGGVQFLSKKLNRLWAC